METLIKELNQYLSDLAVFYRKLQNYHWNVKGSDFFVVHEKLEEYYNKKYVFNKEFMPEIKLASLGNDAGIIGSVIDLK